MLHPRWPMAIVILAAAALSNSAQESSKSRSKVSPIIDARFVDGSNLKLTMVGDSIEIVSPYGRLKVPMDEIKRVDIATRIPADLAARIDAWIVDLGNPQFPIREAAGNELGQLKARAYHALVAATKNKDPEIAKRAGELIEALGLKRGDTNLEFVERPYLQHGGAALQPRQLLRWGLSRMGIRVPDSGPSGDGGTSSLELFLHDPELATKPMRERFGVDLHPEPVLVGHSW